MAPFATPVFDRDSEWINPALGAQPDAYSMQGAAAGTCLLIFANEPTSASHPSYVCIYPRCELRFADEKLLDQHMKTHFSLAFPVLLSPLESNELGSHFSSTNSPCVYENALAVTTDRATSSLDNPPRQNREQAQNITFNHWSPDAKSKDSQITDSYKPFICKHKGCEKALRRMGDLQRHMKSHQDGIREYDCPAPKCRRKGDKGFYRLDKLKDHLNAKHPEIEVEKYMVRSHWHSRTTVGYRDISQRVEHEEMMHRKGFESSWQGIHVFYNK